MKHPQGRSERRFNGEVWRDRQRFKMRHSWFHGNIISHEGNTMWWARKQSSAHGSRCMCHYEKNDSGHIRKRRLGLDPKSRRKTCQLIKR